MTSAWNDQDLRSIINRALELRCVATRHKEALAVVDKEFAELSAAAAMLTGEKGNWLVEVEGTWFLIWFTTHTTGDIAPTEQTRLCLQAIREWTRGQAASSG